MLGPDDTLTPAELQDDMTLLCAAVREAGALAMETFGSDVEFWAKKDHSPVSATDLAVDQLLKTRLLGACPDYGWLSEETDDDPARMECRRLWVVDPIDGTRAFVKGVPAFSISAALVEGHEPVAAAVFNPATDEFYAAMRGAGATCNGAQIKVSARSELEGARILAPQDLLRSHKWLEPWPEIAIENRNSVAYRLCLAASGEFDAVISLTPKSDWDVAAADLIVREAGGEITTHLGASLKFNIAKVTGPSVIAAGPGLYQEIYRRVRHL